MITNDLLIRSLHFAKVSQAAYLDAPDWKSLGYETGIVVKGDLDTQAIVALKYVETPTENNNELVIAFRGSANLENWMMDFDFKFHDDWGCHIHEGFRQCFEAIQPQVFEAVRKLYLTNPLTGLSNTVVTGHSLGAALAQLFAYKFPNGYATNYMPFPNLTAYTYGSPRCGDSVFKKHFKTPHVRVVNDNDIVPRLPFVLAGYRHTNTLYYIDSDGKVLKGQPFWRMVEDFISPRFHPYATDHLIGHYIDALQVVSNTST